MENQNKNLPCKPEFLIKIHHRQRTTWQGEITWLDGTREGQSVFFRSRREMLALIEEAADACKKANPESKLRSWKDEQGLTSKKLKWNLNRDRNDDENKDEDKNEG